MSFDPLKVSRCDSASEEEGRALEEVCIFYPNPAVIFPGGEVRREAVDGIL